MDDIDILLVGARGFGAVHARQIVETPGCRLLGVVDQQLPQDLEVRGWTDLDRALDECDADLVSIATPTSTHLDLVSSVLRSGRRVVVEKPVVTNPDEAAELAALQDELGGWVDVISQRRFQEGPRRLGALLEAGDLGHVATLNCTSAVWRDASYFESPWHGVRARGGGNLLNHGMHLVDLVLWLLGSPVAATGLTAPSRFDGVDIEESCVAAMRFASGTLGVLEASLATRQVEPFRLELRGDAGGAVLTDRRLIVTTAGGVQAETRSCDSDVALGRQYAEIARRLSSDGEPTVGLDSASAALELAWELSATPSAAP